MTRGPLYGVGGALAVLLASLLFPDAMPLGVVLLGALLGTGTGLMAVGLVLTYRTTRIINFSYGAMGSAGAGVAAGLALGKDVPWVIAAPAGVVVGVGIGAVVERLVIRRFANAPRLVLTVATVGLAQALGGLAVFMPSLFDSPPVASGVDTPLTERTIEFDPVLFNGNDLALLAIVPLVLAALSWFLSRTEAGIAVRGMADNMDRARLLGIPVNRLSLLLWSIAGGLAALTVTMRLPTEGISLDAAAAGPTVLLPALAAAVVAGMTSLRGSFAAGVGIGVIDQLVRWNVDRQATTYLVLLAIVVVGLLIQRRIGPRARAASEESSWSVVGAGRSLPTALAQLPEVRAARSGVLAVVAVGVVLIPFVGTTSQVNYATVTLVYAMIAVSLVVLTGWGGVVSLGQVAIVGVGGVVAANLIADHNLDLFVTLAVSGVAGGVVALLLGLPALRVSGQFLAVTTLAFAVAMQLYFLNPANYESLLPSSYSRPELWASAELMDERWLYALTVGLLAVVLVVVRNLRTARTGRVIAAARDNDRAAAAAGVNTVGARLMAFVFAGIIAGLAGAIHAVALRGIGFNAYQAADSLLVFSMAVIGGVASLGGTLAGVALVQWLGYAFPRAQLLLAGVGVLLILMVVPGGLGQVFEHTRDRFSRAVARSRGIRLVDELSTVDEQSGPPEPDAGGAEVLAGPATSGPTRSGYVPDGFAPNEGRGGTPLLTCDGVEASYGSLQVLFGIDAGVGDNEMVALLGTNGAGKSTLLKAVAGLLPPSKGKVVFDGKDISSLPAEKIARRGLSLMPGGKGIFPSLTVAENLRLACWMLRHDRPLARAGLDGVLEMFPILHDRWDQPAGNLSGGEQQQLSLAMAFVTKPKLLCIDELSLGLAPTVVGQLVDKVKEMRRQGTTIVVVEQSINVALLLCERALFLEKGQVRFRGPTAGLLDRPEILRAVFIGAGEGVVTAPTAVLPPEQRPNRGLQLECRQLTKRFGGIRAVDAVDLVVPPGHIVGLIGHNGAGKTTLFDLLTGFLPSDGGQVLLDGVDITDRPPYKRARLELARSFQEARLFPSLSVIDALRVSLERHLANRDPMAAALRLPASTGSERDATDRAEELIELLGLAPYRDRLAGELSTGMRRIVELGCLLGQNPAVILLDEPSAGIAQKETEALGPMLRRVQSVTGCSMVVIEHDINLLSSVCDEFVALEQGAVIARGTPQQVLADPRVIASYLGTNEDVVHRSGSRSPAATGGT